MLKARHKGLLRSLRRGRHTQGNGIRRAGKAVERITGHL